MHNRLRSFILVAVWGKCGTQHPVACTARMRVHTPFSGSQGWRNTLGRGLLNSTTKHMACMSNVRVRLDTSQCQPNPLLLARVGGWGPEKLVCEAVCESFSGHRNGHIKHQISARINACSGKLHPFPFSSELLCSFPFLFFQAAGDARPGRSKNLWLQAIFQSPRLCVPDFSCVSLLGVVALILM